MKAIVVSSPGPVSQLQLEEVEKPVIQEGEVLIQVKAISINPVDVKSRAGKGVYGRLKDQNPLILGWDISGVVTASRSEAFKPGDAVFGMVNFPGHGRAYAEYVAAPAAHLALKPDNISFEEAAAATLAALTAWQAMVHNAKVQAAQKVLVHAAAGGVGHFAVQLAKHLGAHVTGTSSARNKAFVLASGADAHIDYTTYDWASHPEEFDFVLDTIGGDTIEHSLLVTKKGGTVISIPTGLNETVTEKAKAKGVHGYFMLVQSNGADMQQLALLLEKGILKAHVSNTYPFTEMANAHLQLESGRTIGKVVVTL
ncbi:NADPH:quinone reductase-like Zn-dependent oxidoreductase [Filimonas zeae]|uniref:NADPH:quinone reductase n=1 Tax=Filimonas zeae TaxID=1737353 RepID=A0A917MYZ3_9BACT|nr:NADP-dependent oxidoreductase [Filimonas zeae]MDR6340472.1 NADPH:quinone reductase-like Zn-dependent oxidoreductase [Filimonas zeae]GGH72900.1 NADPH:quinone reductase [Filimonas zeae]